ncbi:MAG: coproporphyrinogen III oxidase [Dehalococcoidia bacterium]|nr:coproporphyrinogen III oxidase [Dehalococcoidia bacterium]
MLGTPTQIVPSSGMSLYIHVPFCNTKCPYCDFNTYQGIERLFTPYVKALTTEIALWGKVLDSPSINTIFFGGGTPSYLPQGSIGEIIESVRSNFSINHEAEITIEANPGDITLDSCTRLLKEGVNRLSIGVQSLDNDLLTMLGRRHDSAQAIESCKAASTAGFKNISLDLMYGLPNQNIEHWKRTLENLVALDPKHISLYSLTLEEGTPLHTWVEQGKLPTPDPDVAADMYHYAEESLEYHGYAHYEISNWSKPDHASRHNMAYWLNHPYVGVGPGAHSRLGSYRFWTVDSPRTYIEGAATWSKSNPSCFEKFADQEIDSIPTIAGYEHISPDMRASESMFLGLRLLDGINIAEMSHTIGTDLEVLYKTEIAESLSLGLLEEHNGLLRLTKDTYLIANQVFTKFID